MFGVNDPDLGHFNRCVVISYFSLYFPDGIQYGATFHRLICNLYIFLVKCLLSSLAHFLKLSCLVSYCWVLRVFHIFWTTNIYHIYLLQVFSPSVWIVFYTLGIIFSRVKVSNFKVVQFIKSTEREIEREREWVCVLILPWVTNLCRAYMNVCGITIKQHIY